MGEKNHNFYFCLKIIKIYVFHFCGEKCPCSSCFLWKKNQEKEKGEKRKKKPKFSSWKKGREKKSPHAPVAQQFSVDFCFKEKTID